MEELRINGHRLTWEEFSPGEETVIFINGWSGNRTMWRPLLEFLDMRLRVVALDLVGHYPATLPDGAATLAEDEIYDTQAEAIAAVAGDKPVTLVGHSMGGLVSLATAARKPELVRGLAAIAPPGWGKPGGILGVAWHARNRGHKALSRALLKTTMAAPWTMRAGIAGTFYRRDAFARNQFLAQTCEAGFQEYARHNAEWVMLMLDYLGRFDARPWLPEVQAPALIFGGAQDPLARPGQQQWMGMHVPNARVEMYRQTGHWPHLESPHEFKGRLLAWLEDLGLEPRKRRRWGT